MQLFPMRTTVLLIKTSIISNNEKYLLRVDIFILPSHSPAEFSVTEREVEGFITRIEFRWIVKARF